MTTAQRLTRGGVLANAQAVSIHAKLVDSAIQLNCTLSVPVSRPSSCANSSSSQ